MVELARSLWRLMGPPQWLTRLQGRGQAGAPGGALPLIFESFANTLVSEETRMLVYEAVGGLILTQCPDRRKRERLEHREPAHIDGRRAVTRDISPTGLSISTLARVVPGQVVQVTLGYAPGSAAEFSTSARVVRVQPGRGTSLVGLEFLE